MIVRYPQDNHRDTFCVLMELLKVRGFFPSLWEGLGEGAKLGAHKPSSQPSPKGEGESFKLKVYRTFATRLTRYQIFGDLYACRCRPRSRTISESK